MVQLLQNGHTALYAASVAGNEAIARALLACPVRLAFSKLYMDNMGGMNIERWPPSRVLCERLRILTVCIHLTFSI